MINQQIVELMFEKKQFKKQTAWFLKIVQHGNKSFRTTTPYENLSHISAQPMALPIWMCNPEIAERIPILY